MNCPVWTRMPWCGREELITPLYPIGKLLFWFLVSPDAGDDLPLRPICRGVQLDISLSVGQQHELALNTVRSAPDANLRRDHSRPRPA